MSKDVFQRYSQYYDLLYRDKDYAAEAAYVMRLLRKIAPPARELLEFGSGTGRHGRLLAKHGFNVFGIERSEAMVRMAKKVPPGQSAQQKATFDCMSGNVRTVNLDRIFDAVIALFHVVGYQTKNEDLIQTFDTAARHLNKGGLFMFDVWHGPAVLVERPSVRVKRVEDNKVLLTRIAEPEIDTNTSVVTVHYTMLAESKVNAKLITFGEDHHMRYLFPTEIDLIARQCGFHVQYSEEFMTGNPVSESTWGVIYLLRKL